MVTPDRAELDDFLSLGRALRLRTGALEIVATLDVGPRIMHLSLPGGPNLFSDRCALKEELPDGSVYEYFGGHRLWHSPEAFPRTYVPDSHPLAGCETSEDGILLLQHEEPWTHIVKSVRLRFTPASVVVRSTLTNAGAWPIETAAWSMILGSPNGRLILPVAQKDTGLLPGTRYVLWPYSRMDDPRVRWGRRYVVVDHDENDDEAFKLGYPNESGWMAYLNHDCCFLKTFRHDPGAVYPDGGCSTEAYTAGWGIDIESLSPLQLVQPGGSISHEEEWWVFPCPGRPSSDDEITRLLEPFARRAGFRLPASAPPAWDPQREKDV